jgi:hypothetical protein
MTSHCNRQTCSRIPKNAGCLLVPRILENAATAECGFTIFEIILLALSG